MIEMQAQLEPSSTLQWKFYTPTAEIGWLHAETRELQSDDQVFPSSGTRTVIPTAVFSIVTSVYNWTVSEW
jgi:hypothetical protein